MRRLLLLLPLILPIAGGRKAGAYSIEDLVPILEAGVAPDPSPLPERLVEWRSADAERHRVAAPGARRWPAEPLHPELLLQVTLVPQIADPPLNRRDSSAKGEDCACLLLGIVFVFACLSLCVLPLRRAPRDAVVVTAEPV
jgi:hypothetical protein